MMIQILALGLFFLAGMVRAAEMSGYVMDKQCINLCTGVPANTTCTPDRVNSFYQPEKHTGWCLLLSVCVSSGYVLLSEEPGEDGMHIILLDFAGEESQANILAFIQDGTQGFFPRVTVEYNETLAEEIDGVIHAQNAIAKDPWEGTSNYDGADTHQVLCPDSTSPDLFSNNLCMRSDILVTTMSDMYTIESNGCPNHANMMGSTGKIVNSQSDPSGTPEAQNESDSQGCGAGCGAGCGSCGAGCTSCAAGCDGYPYEPRYQHYTMEIPVNPGDPGEANYFGGDEVVGIMVNGVVLDSHKATWSYDNCNGHSDTKHQYHYHIPPICFLESMGIPTPDSASWWISDTGDSVRPYEDMAAQFLSTAASGSPVIGFARDGYPIFGPYDENGQLQRGAEYGGDLDECNGKVDSNGNYGYYLTVDPPFAPPCLRGKKGLFTYYTTAKACPGSGIKTTIVEPSSVATLCETISFSEVGNCVAAGTFEDDESNAPEGLASATVAAAVALTAAVFGQL